MKRFLLSCAVLLLAVLVRAETDKITALRAKAEAGNAVAQCTLGLFYSLGEGLPKDALPINPSLPCLGAERG